MNFEELQNHWQQQQSSRQALKINADLVLQEVRRNQRSFETTIFWRDFRETGAALVAALGFVFQAQDWTHYLLALAGAGVGTYILVDRLRQRKNRPLQSDSLKSFAERSLLQWRHQTWLLRNVLWWYLLPLTVPILISIAVQADTVRQAAIHSAIIVALSWLIYQLNQNAVRKYLAPRERELELLLAGIEEPPVDQPPPSMPC